MGKRCYKRGIKVGTGNCMIQFFTRDQMGFWLKFLVWIYYLYTFYSIYIILNSYLNRQCKMCFTFFCLKYSRLHPKVIV